MRRCLLVVFSIGVLGLTGCASAQQDRSNASPDKAVQVLAAASLQQAFDDIAAEFAAEHPEIDIDLSYAGSSTLVHNVDAGAPADVLATADEASMDTAEEAELIDATTRTVVATNTLVGIVPADNPAGVDSLDDLAQPEVNTVICAPQVPCGTLARTIADQAGITLNPVSEEHQVVDVVGKVRSGQADAGLVYATDAAGASDEVHDFSLEGAADFPNFYPIARTAEARDRPSADAFIDFVQSDRGQAILEAHGFGLPEVESG